MNTWSRFFYELARFAVNVCAIGAVVMAYWRLGHNDMPGVVVALLVFVSADMTSTAMRVRYSK